MPLTLVTGRANAGKTGLIHGLVREAALDGRLPALVVPGTADARLAREEFARAMPLLGIRVATFDGLLRDLWGRFGDGRALVTEAQRRALLRRAVGSTKLTALKESSERPGLLTLLAQVAGLLEGEPDSRLLGRPGAGGDILRVMVSYLRTLEATGLVEGSVAAAVLARSVESEWFEGPVGVNRFSDLTGAQERLFTGIGDAGVDVWVALPWEADFPATRALDTLVGRLVERGASMKRAGEVTRAESTEIAYLESHLFRDPSDALGASVTGCVRLSEACGEEAEADRIACEVRAALADGVEPSRVGVVFRDPARHVRAIARSFAEASVAANYDALVPADKSGLGRALNHLLAYVSGEQRIDLSAFLRSPYSGMETAAREALERRWRRSRSTGRSVLERDLQRSDRGALRSIELARGLADAAGTPHIAERWQDLAAQLLRNAYGTGAPILDAAGESDAATQRALMETVGELASIEGLDPRPRDVLEGLAAKRIPMETEDVRDRVQVMSAHRARSRRFDVLIVGGLTDGDFPPSVTENALSAVGVVGALEEAGLATRRLEQQDAERLLFYLAVTRATKRLVLSRQVADSDGKPLRASWLLDELLDVYRAPGAEDAEEPALPPVSALGFDESGLAPGAPASLRRALRSAAGTGAVTGSGGRQDHRLVEASRRAAGRSPGLHTEEALEYLARDRPYSATEIEAYLACPYSWFHDRVVRPERMDARIDARAQGTLMHDALKAVFERLPARTGANRVTPNNVGDALCLASAVIDELMASIPAPSTFAEEAALIAVKRHVTGFIQADAEFLPEFSPIALEESFGRDDPVPFEGFDLLGRIDRIDSNADGLLVVSDYKKKATIDSAYGRANMLETGRVQLALYARVVEARLGRPVVAAFYRGISGRNVAAKRSRGFFRGDVLAGAGLVSTDRIEGDELRVLLDNAERLAREAVLGMRSGDITPRPRNKKKTCDYCAVRLVCPGRMS